ncbi:hypothetical protein [Paenibacillus marinisediminis]
MRAESDMPITPAETVSLQHTICLQPQLHDHYAYSSRRPSSLTKRLI